MIQEIRMFSVSDRAFNKPQINFEANRLVDLTSMKKVSDEEMGVSSGVFQQTTLIYGTGWSLVRPNLVSRIISLSSVSLSLTLTLSLPLSPSLPCLSLPPPSLSLSPSLTYVLLSLMSFYLLSYLQDRSELPGRWTFVTETGKVCLVQEPPLVKGMLGHFCGDDALAYCTDAVEIYLTKFRFYIR